MGKNAPRRAVLIAGPTASGKSALAIRLAASLGGTIVNTDALQVYSGLRIVTARPDAADMAAIPHALYGTVDPAERFSTGGWLDAVGKHIAASSDPLIFVGGTGLYFDALQHGFAPVPAVPAALVSGVEAEMAGLDSAGRLQRLEAEDPEMAHRLAAPDPQRVIRALSVIRATGRSLATYQDLDQPGLLDGFEVERLIVDPGRDVLRARIADRFERMFASGGIEEVAALLERRLDPGLPAMKAIGVPEIAAYIEGRLGRSDAIQLAVIATRQYAKRQRTWLRNRMADWPRREPDSA